MYPKYLPLSSSVMGNFLAKCFLKLLPFPPPVSTLCAPKGSKVSLVSSPHLKMRNFHCLWGVDMEGQLAFSPEVVRFTDKEPRVPV